MGGECGRVEAKASRPSHRENAAEAVSGAKTSAGGNSNFFNENVESVLRSADFPFAIALQRQQGCLPSKVISIARLNEVVRKFPANIEDQATD